MRAQAGCSLKAIEAALASRQWAKAAQIVEMQEESVARPYLRVIADHYAEVRDYSLAQKYYVASKNPRMAIDMYIKVSLHIAEASEGIQALEGTRATVTVWTW